MTHTDALTMERFPNLVTMFFDRAAKKGNAPFLHAKKDGVWQAISWHDAACRVAGFARRLREIGLRDGDRVVLVSENRPEWCLADLGIMAAGCVTVPTYTTNTERDHQHILDNSGARAVVVSQAKLAKALMPAVLRSNVRHVISIEDLRIGQQGDVAIHNWTEMTAACAQSLAPAAERMTKVGRDDLACIIYTSGTGGAPRGVRQHHGAILHNVEGCHQIIAEDFGMGNERFLSFLPLSHAYEHTGGQHVAIGCGGEIYYAESLEKLVGNIEEVRPTIMFVVPRLFEVIRQKMLKAVEKQGRVAQFMLDRALKIGRRTYEKGHVPFFDRPMDLVVGKALRPKIAARFGGQLKALISGGAPLNPDVGIFFHSLGITLLQGYGQTEAAPVISCNRPAAGIRMETVGPPLPRTEVRIADDGEILVQGELVMHGYWNNEAETERVLIDGWLHTGDVGHIDAAGRIVITDRKKDLIVNDKGDNISPQRVEGILTLQPEIHQAMVYGDRRPYIVAIIVPDPDWLRETALSHGLPQDPSLLVNHEPVKAALRAAIDRVNRDLSSLEKIRRFDIVTEAFTVENEQMTPSMKIRRHVLRAVYQDRIAALYGDEPAPAS